MEIDREEARAALEDAKAYAARMKKAMNAFGAAYHFIVWGAIWIVGFSLDQFAPLLPEPVNVWHWLVLNVAGNVASFSISARGRRYLRVGPQGGIALIWILFMAFGGLGALFVRPAGFKEGSMLLVLLIMLWMAVMGALMNRVLLCVALGVTAVAVGAYYLLPDAFYLIMAVVGGTSLIAIGVAILARREK